MNSLFNCIRHLGIRLGLRYWLLNRRAKRDPEVIRDFARACRREAFFCDDSEVGNRLSDFARQCDRSYESLQNPIKTFIPLIISVLLLSACAYTNPTLAKFNAAAVPRAKEDAIAAIGGATGAVAAQLGSSLTTTGKIDTSLLGAAATAGAINALLKLDEQRAQQTNP